MYISFQGISKSFAVTNNYSASYDIMILRPLKNGQEFLYNH